MQLLHVKQVIHSINYKKAHNVYKDKIIYINGYLVEDRLYENKSAYIDSDHEFIEISAITGGIRDKIIKSIGQDKIGVEVNMVCYVRQLIRIVINHIFKIELLDGEGNIKDSVKVNEMSMPKELRGQI